MTGLDRVVAEIRSITIRLMEMGLVRSQQWPTQKRVRSISSVSFGGHEHIARAMSMKEYAGSYKHMAAMRAYNAMMLDGAMVSVRATPFAPSPIGVPAGTGLGRIPECTGRLPPRRTSRSHRRASLGPTTVED